MQQNQEVGAQESDTRPQSPLLSAVRAKRAAQAQWEADQKQEFFAEQPERGLARPSPFSSGVTFGAEWMEAPFPTVELPQTSIGLLESYIDGGDDLGEPIYDISTDEAIDRDGEMPVGLSNGESDKIPPPPSPPCTCGKNLELPENLDPIHGVSGHPRGDPSSMEEARGGQRPLSGLPPGVGLPYATRAESAAGDVASSLVVSPPPAIAIHPRFYSLSRCQRPLHLFRDAQGAGMPDDALPPPPRQFGDHARERRRAASGRSCDLDLGREISPPPGGEWITASAAAQGPDETADDVQQAVLQRRSGSRGRAHSIDFDPHWAHASPAFLHEPWAATHAHAAADSRPRSGAAALSNGHVKDSVSTPRQPGFDVDMDGGLAEDRDRLLEKKLQRHKRSGTMGSGGGSGEKRPFHATLLRGERGLSIKFGKFVALISISGVRRQHCLLTAVVALLLLICLVVGLALSGGGKSGRGTEWGQSSDYEATESSTVTKTTSTTLSATTITTSTTISTTSTTNTQGTTTKTSSTTVRTTQEPSTLPWPKNSEERKIFVRKLLSEVPLVDGHNDLPWNIRKFIHNKLNTVNFTHDLRSVSPWSRSPWSHTDLKRLREGMVGAQLWVAYAPCGSQHKDAVQVTLEQIDLIKRFVAQYPEHMRFANDSAGLSEAHAEGKVASLISVESGHSIGTSLAVLRMFHRLGAVSLTLTHTCNTPWADCSQVDKPGVPPEHGGLTEFGKTVVREMNRLGMIVDLSHSSHQTSLDAIHTSEAPVIFSHSSAHGICNSTRNVHDDVLRVVGQRGGLVMVNFFSHFLTCSNSSSIYHVVEHLNHIRAIAGVDCVGIGASYDGINSAPHMLEDVSKYPELFSALLASGTWTLEDLKKLAGLNFIRVFKEVEEVSARLQAVLPIAEEVIPGEAIRDKFECRSMAKRDANNTAC